MKKNIAMTRAQLFHENIEQEIKSELKNHLVTVVQFSMMSNALFRNENGFHKSWTRFQKS